MLTRKILLYNVKAWYHPKNVRVSRHSTISAAIRCWYLDQIFARENSSFRCRRKTVGPRENLWKQVWTGNQMHMCRSWKSKPGPVGGTPPCHLIPPEQNSTSIHSERLELCMISWNNFRISVILSDNIWCDWHKASELVPCSLLPHWNSMQFSVTVSLYDSNSMGEVKFATL